MKQKITLRCNPKVSKETRAKAKRAVNAVFEHKTMIKRATKYTAGIDVFKEGGKSGGSCVIWSNGRIVYHTKKLWKMNLLIWVLKILGIRILKETNESTN